ncbi:MAG: thioredoxin domain-containing protein, partial [Gammaproteobacteria bacterium]|nr:thioredoxin domain-containing protein [Gammaproteobacteria bacterium]
MLARILKRPRPDTLLALSLCLVLSLSGAGRALAVDDEPLFDIDGRTYTVHELPQRLRDRLYQLEKRQFEERLALLDSMLFELHVRAEAERTGEAAASIAERLLHLEDPTEADIQAYYEEHAQSIGRPLQEAREQIGLQLRSQALLQRRQKLLADIKAEREFKLHQTPPAPAPVDIDVSEYARRGPADAPITVVEFGDYQCPRCRDAGSIISRLMEKYPGELQWYYLDFPVNRSGISTIVAYGGICAHRQDHFWSYHDLAFDEQARLDNESALELARALDLDL